VRASNRPSNQVSSLFSLFASDHILPSLSLPLLPLGPLLAMNDTSAGSSSSNEAAAPAALTWKAPQIQVKATTVGVASHPRAGSKHVPYLYASIDVDPNQTHKINSKVCSSLRSFFSSATRLWRLEDGRGRRKVWLDVSSSSWEVSAVDAQELWCLEKKTFFNFLTFFSISETISLVDSFFPVRFRR